MISEPQPRACHISVIQRSLSIQIQFQSIMSAAMPKVDDAASVCPVIEIDSKDSVTNAFKILVENHILAAPVYDATEQKYLGFFDTSDMGAYVLKTLHESSPGGEKEVPMEFCDVGDLMKTVEAIHPSTMGEVSNLSGIDEFASVSPGDPLLDVLSLLAKGHHRVAVVDPATKRCRSIVSQSNIVKNLAGVQ